MAKKITTKNFTMFDNMVVVKVDDLEVSVKRTLSLDEYLNFVHQVVSYCFDDEDNTYRPESKDFALKEALVEFYSDVKLPSSIDKSYEIFYRTGLIQAILRVIDEGQYQEMVSAIDELIAHRVALLESSAETAARNMMRQMSEFVEKTEGIFGRVGGDDMAAAITNLAKISEVAGEDIVGAILSGEKQS